LVGCDLHSWKQQVPVLDPDTAEGDYERLPGLARELVARRVDVIVTDGTPPTRAAMQVTKTVSIVMAPAADPVGSGLVNSLARPGGNVTGVSIFFNDINGKRLELLKEAVPSIALVAAVYNPLNPVVESAVGAIEAAGKPLKVRIQRLAVRSPADFDGVFPVMTRQRVDVITVVEDVMITSQALRVVEVASKGRVPARFGLSSLPWPVASCRTGRAVPISGVERRCSRTRSSGARSPAT